MKNPVQNGTGDDRVSKDLSPVGIGLVRGENHRAFLIPSGNQLEKQVGSQAIDRDIADFIDNQEFVLGQPLELFFQTPFLMEPGQRGDQGLGSDK